MFKKIINFIKKTCDTDKTITLYEQKLIDDEKKYFNDINCNFFKEPFNSNSSYCLNSIIFENKKQEDDFFKFSNDNGGMSSSVIV